MENFLFIIWLGAVGAAVGSFLNVVIYRLPRGESLVSPPSHCPKCNHKIRVYDNLPIFGWFLLGGKCRDCKQPISFRYPLIEIIACTIVTTFAVLIMPAGLATALATEEGFSKTAVLVFAKIGWFSALHLFLLTLGMVDFDRQTLKQGFLGGFLTIFLIFGVVFSAFDTVVGGMASLTLGFLLTKIIRANDHNLWLYATLAVGIFLGWQPAILILLAALPLHAAIVFVTRRPCAVLSLAGASFFVNVWMLVR